MSKNLVGFSNFRRSNERDQQMVGGKKNLRLQLNIGPKHQKIAIIITEE